MTHGAAYSIDLLMTHVTEDKGLIFYSGQEDPMAPFRFSQSQPLLFSPSSPCVPFQIRNTTLLPLTEPFLMLSIQKSFSHVSTSPSYPSPSHFTLDFTPQRDFQIILNFVSIFTCSLTTEFLYQYEVIY